ncbi:MAG: alpha/beta fold hydrolase [Chromatiaceae bacterium]|nr:MAG: alpha/beta fold hydrolase [Chromatiaceae bacterium]
MIDDRRGQTDPRTPNARTGPDRGSPNLNGNPHQGNRGPQVLLLHGFTGSAADWAAPTAAGLVGSAAGALVRNPVCDPLIDPAIAAAIAIDLPGHGNAAAPAGPPEPGCFERQMAALLAQLPPTIEHLVGYSLGGRVALGLLRAAPGRFRAATLISAHPGLQDPARIAARRAADRRWSDLLQQQGIAAFVAAWEAQPLFATQARLPAARLAAQRAGRLSQRPAGLAAALAHLGLAEMPDMRPTLIAFPGPLHWIVGAADTRFAALAAEIVSLRPATRIHRLPGCGHNPLLEAPLQLRALLAAALQHGP